MASKEKIRNANFLRSQEPGARSLVILGIHSFPKKLLTSGSWLPTPFLFTPLYPE
jgi:hypothetical protein